MSANLRSSGHNFNIASTQRFGSKQCGTITLENGTVLFVSYNTVVGIKAGSIAKFTAEKFSVTTSKQQNFMMRSVSGEVVTIPASEFDALVNSEGLIRRVAGFMK